jgi:hypothetical protein
MAGLVAPWEDTVSLEILVLYIRHDETTRQYFLLNLYRLVTF